MGETLRWGILGTGMIAAKVAPCIRQAAGCSLTCVASRDGDRARAFASSLGLPASAACDAEALLARSDVDAVYVTVPNSLHTPWSVRLLEAGKHVICEKPLTPRAEEARAVGAAAAKAGRVFAEGFMYLHHPQTDLLVRAGREGEPGLIGRVRTVVASFCIDLRPRPNAWTRFSHRLEGGAMLDLGCYPLSLARTVLGEEPVHLGATAREAAPQPGESRGVDALTSFSARFKSEAVLHALCAIDANAGVFAELVGETGVLRTETPFRADPVRAELRLTRFENHPRGAGVETIVIENGGDRFVNQFGAFARAVRERRAMTPTPDWSVGQAAAIETITGMTGCGW
ncbi:MAG: Gfo/Idh/MocA family oxidoreductase [Planctomycetes bacterium]|nr:Gfo/Idh/MocA family oxidoreductase [Planctomycetota bacterium]